MSAPPVNQRRRGRPPGSKNYKKREPKPPTEARPATVSNMVLTLATDGAGETVFTTEEAVARIEQTLTGDTAVQKLLDLQIKDRLQKSKKPWKALKDLRDSAFGFTYYLPKEAPPTDRSSSDAVNSIAKQLEKQLYEWIETLWSGKVLFFTGQIELGEDAERGPHIQGYCELAYRMRVPGQIKREIFGDTHSHVHIDTRKGEQHEMVQYVSKSTTRIAGPWTWPTGATPRPSQQGKRNDLSDIVEAVWDAVNAPNRLDKMIHLFTGTNRASVARYLPYIDRLQNMMLQRKHRGVFRSPMDIIVIHGAEGCGKSERIFELVGENSFSLSGPMVSSGQVWFQAYCCEEIFWIDECVTEISYLKLLQYLDRFPLVIQQKNGHAFAAWRVIFITTNVNPTDWYGGIEKIGVHSRAIMRRITQEVQVRPDGFKSRTRIDRATFGPWVETKGRFSQFTPKISNPNRRLFDPRDVEHEPWDGIVEDDAMAAHQWDNGEIYDTEPMPKLPRMEYGTDEVATEAGDVEIYHDDPVESDDATFSDDLVGVHASTLVDNNSGTDEWLAF